MWNDKTDERDNSIKLPDSLAPTTEDHNIIYVDPSAEGPFSAPNPVSPNQWRKDLRASIGPSKDVTAIGAPPDIYPRLVTRVISSALGNINPLNAEQPAPPALPFTLSDNPNSMGGLAGRLAALVNIEPENPEQPVPQPGGLLGNFLTGRR
jgi:hypothetical protein